jgi:hypothetical protein
MTLRSINVRTAAFAIGTTTKWLDNLLARHRLPGVSQGTQGVERRITDEGLLGIELTRLLVTEFAMPLPQSVAVVRTVLENRTGNDGRFVAPGGVAIHFPFDRIQERLRIQILSAIEAVPNVSRGRPRRGRR